MLYQSTRCAGLTASPAEAVLQGLAPDGGLFVPSSLPRLTPAELEGLDPYALSARVLGALLPELDGMDELVRQAYEGRFSAPDLTPLRPVGDRWVLELWHGPTSAFKDVALCLLPRLMLRAKKQLGDDTLTHVLTATSGDTGKAALSGFQDVPGTKITVFYPEDGVSAMQKAQMVTQAGENVRVCGVRGNFDDAQSGVKAIFSAWAADPAQRQSGVKLSSANSINIGRLAPQVVYYYKAYLDLCRMGRIRMGEPLDFTVPTGNFGDILAGFLAGQMGLPVGRLVCASNENNVLTDFFQTGVYDRRRPFHKTLSPSMDILISSNLERLLWLMTRDEAKVAQWMRELAETGRYDVGEALRRALDARFAAGWADDEAALSAMGRLWRAHGYLADTHTAVAWAVSEQIAPQGKTERPMVVLSTASAYKFPQAALKALGLRPAETDFDALWALHDATVVPVPSGLAALQGLPVRHRDVIAPGEMADYVARQG